MAPAFIYKACTPKGEKHQGIIVSSDKYQAVSRLRQKGYLVTKIRRREQGFSLPLPLLSPGLSSKDLAFFCRQLSTMLAAGLALVPSLEILEKQQLTSKMEKRVARLKEEVIGGRQLSEAMGSQPRIFPPSLVHMVAAGETGGAVAEVLARMAHHFEKEHNLRERVKGAMTYPLAVILLTMGALVFLFTYVLPTFAALFASSGLILPWPTRGLLAFSRFITGRWYWLTGSSLLLLLGLLWYLRSEGGSLGRDRLLLALPVVGPVWQKIALSRIGRTLGLLLSGGVPLLAAMDVVRNTVDNQVINRALEKLAAGIKEGSEMAVLLQDYPFFPEMMIQMVKVGEETGALPELLLRLADYYEWEADCILQRLSSLLEPVLTIVVAGLVGFVVISIMLPLLDLVQIIG